MNRPAPDAHFTPDWLALREGVDARSRSDCLTRLAADWLVARPGVHGVVDLGAGSGSNLRFLAPRLPGPQRWRLVDHDPALLARARHQGNRLCDGAGTQVTLETRCRDLAPVDDDLLAGADLVVASALFDLVSRDWVETLGTACAERRQALLVALSVDGDWAFLDAAGERLDAAEDAAVRALVRAHQRRDKGLGAALGGEAPGVLAGAMTAAGYRVERAATPWHLAAGDAEGMALAAALVDGWHDAAREQAPAEGGRLARWRERRLAGLADGELGVMVGHRDLLALPPSPADGR